MFEVCYWQLSKMGIIYYCECYSNLNLDYVVFFILGKCCVLWFSLFKISQVFVVNFKIQMFIDFKGYFY